MKNYNQIKNSSFKELKASRKKRLISTTVNFIKVMLKSAGDSREIEKCGFNFSQCNF